MYSIVQVSDLLELGLPEWSKGRILIGVKEPVTLDIGKVIETAYFHERQEVGQTRPTGHEILASLVKGYNANEDKAGKIYPVQPNDAINGHCGLKELLWLQQNWNTFPNSFHVWAYGKLLYGHRDIIRDYRGFLFSPCLDCGDGFPGLDWFWLDDQWSDVEPGLCQ
jgi:hypothetical protein